MEYINFDFYNILVNLFNDFLYLVFIIILLVVSVIFFKKMKNYFLNYIYTKELGNIIPINVKVVYKNDYTVIQHFSEGIYGGYYEAPMKHYVVGLEFGEETIIVDDLKLFNKVHIGQNINIKAQKMYNKYWFKKDKEYIGLRFVNIIDKLS